MTVPLRQVDVGVHQKTSVEIDYEATLDRLEQHWGSIDQKVTLACTHCACIASHHGGLSVGVCACVQVDDLAGELREWFAKVEGASGEASLRRVVFDISALAPLVADRLGVPSIGISNFTWYWLQHLSARPVML
jgi:hypothetical protein